MWLCPCKFPTQDNDSEGKFPRYLNHRHFYQVIVDYLLHFEEERCRGQGLEWLEEHPLTLLNSIAKQYNGKGDVYSAAFCTGNCTCHPSSMLRGRWCGHQVCLSTLPMSNEKAKAMEKWDVTLIQTLNGLIYRLINQKQASYIHCHTFGEPWNTCLMSL